MKKLVLFTPYTSKAIDLYAQTQCTKHHNSSLYSALVFHSYLQQLLRVELPFFFSLFTLNPFNKVWFRYLVYSCIAIKVHNLPFTVRAKADY